jgi:Tol biopolymer transport system component
MLFSASRKCDRIARRDGVKESRKNKITGLAMLALAALACDLEIPLRQPAASLPHEDRWGIYSLDLASQDVQLIYSSPNEIINLDLDPSGTRLAFSQEAGGDALADSEIFTLETSGQGVQRLTDNRYLETYPVWSPDGSQILYLAWPDDSLDIYRMAADGSHAGLFYDSGSHDGDIDWVGDLVAFTRDSRIWLIRSDGSGARQLTDPPRAGEWGNTNLPFGDYDPRISPDGARLVFERLVDDRSPHGNYDLFTIGIDGSGLTRLTSSGHTQGLANWSHAGDWISYIVTTEADGTPRFDVWLTRPDGTENRDVTPAYFPAQFLVHWAAFSGNDTHLYFIGEWWPDE